MSYDGYDMFSAGETISCPECRGEKEVFIAYEMKTWPDGTQESHGKMEPCAKCQGTGEIEE